MTHISLKINKEIKVDFDLTETIKDTKLSDESQKILDDYSKSNKFAEEYDYDLILQTNDSLIFGFEFISNGEKLMIPEINPVTIYFSNAIMSNVKIQEYKKIL